jgi:exodeoxyribonuclease VII large subunit
MTQDVITVTELNRYIKANFDDDLILSRVWVKGEISNLRHYQAGGQIYFTLKDSQATISCVVFHNVAKGLKYELKDNQSIIIRGKVSLFEKRGSISLQVHYIEPVGVGDLALAFEQLKARLLA